jgi:hypothetical protein
LKNGIVGSDEELASLDEFLGGRKELPAVLLIECA